MSTTTNQGRKGLNWTVFLTMVVTVLPEIIALLNMADSDQEIGLVFSRNAKDINKINIQKQVDGKTLSTRTVKGTVS